MTEKAAAVFYFFLSDKSLSQNPRQGTTTARQPQHFPFVTLFADLLTHAASQSTNREEKLHKYAEQHRIKQVYIPILYKNQPITLRNDHWKPHEGPQRLPENTVVNFPNGQNEWKKASRKKKKQL